MSKTRFIIRLKAAHDQTGLTAYAVAKELGLNQNTVRKYISEDVVAEMLPAYIVDLARFYGLELRDVIQIIETDEDPEIKTPLAVAS